MKIQVYIRRISNTFALRIYFLEQIFEGNNPSTKTVKHELLREVIPLYIRLNVKDSTATYAGLKLELYGCKRKYIIFPVICSAVALSSRIRSTSRSTDCFTLELFQRLMVIAVISKSESSFHGLFSLIDIDERYLATV